MLFQTPSLVLMTLDSWITQLDFCEEFLLVSTLTRSYVCNTYLETCNQVGKKLRNGEFGSCFCLVSRNNRLNLDIEESIESNYDKNTDNMKTNSYDAIEEAEEANMIESRRMGRFYKNENNSKRQWRGFCARPGSRLWEIDKNGRVLITHQLKTALNISPCCTISLSNEENSINVNQELKKSSAITINSGAHKVESLLNKSPPDLSNSFNKSFENNTAHNTNYLSSSVSFKKLMTFYDNYILATSNSGIYIIDPVNSKILVWTPIDQEINCVKVSGNYLIYSTNSGIIRKLIVSTIDVAILILHSKCLYEICAKLCVQHSSIFTTSKLLIHLGQKVLKDLLSNIEDKGIYNSIIRMKRSFFPESQDIIDIDDSYSSQGTELAFGSYTKSDLQESFSESGSHLKTDINKYNPPKGRLHNRKSRTADNSPERANIINKEFSLSYDMQKISIDSLHLVSDRITQEYSRNTIRSEIEASYSSQKRDNSDSKSSSSSFLSSQDVNDDFPFPGYEEKIIDTRNRSYDRRSSRYNDNYASTAAYGFGYAPLLPGSEAASAIQDLVENVTSSVISTISSSTKTFKGKLRNVSRKNSDLGNSMFSQLSNSVLDGMDYYEDSKTSDECDTENERASNGDLDDIVINKKNFKKLEGSVKDSPRCMSRISNISDQESISQSTQEVPQILKDLQELLISTKHKIIQTTNKSEIKNYLTDWMTLYCSTTHKILLMKFQKNLDTECQLDGSMSLTSIESNYSLCSSEASLNWDFNDLSIDTFSNNGMIDDITDLFIECFKEKITVSSVVLKLVYDSYNPPHHHPLTSDQDCELDSFYARLINVDCDLLKYSLIFEKLMEDCNCYLLQTWYSLMEKLTCNSMISVQDNLTDFFIDLDLSHSQSLIFLKNFALNKDLDHFMETASKIDDSQIIFYIILFSRCLEMNMNSDEIVHDRSNYILFKYLRKLSETKDLASLYLTNWYKCSELQYDLVRCILGKGFPNSHFCNMLCNSKDNSEISLVDQDFIEIFDQSNLVNEIKEIDESMTLAIKNLLKTIFKYQIIHPQEFLKLCKDTNYWYGYCSTIVNYNADPIEDWMPYVFQSFQKPTIRLAFESIDFNSYKSIIDLLVFMSMDNECKYKCFKCKRVVDIPEFDDSLLIDDKFSVVLNEEVINSNGNEIAIQSDDNNLYESYYKMIMTSLDCQYNNESIVSDDKKTSLNTLKDTSSNFNTSKKRPSSLILNPLNENNGEDMKIINLLHQKSIQKSIKAQEMMRSSSMSSLNVSSTKSELPSIFKKEFPELLCELEKENYTDKSNQDSSSIKEGVLLNKSQSQSTLSFSNILDGLLSTYVDGDLSDIPFADSNIIMGDEDEKIIYGKDVSAYDEGESDLQSLTDVIVPSTSHPNDTFTTSEDLKSNENLKESSKSSPIKSFSKSSSIDLDVIDNKSNEEIVEKSNDHQNEIPLTKDDISEDFKLSFAHNISNMKELWEVVLAEMLRHAGSKKTLALLHDAYETIPSKYITKRSVFGVFCLLQIVI